MGFAFASPLATQTGSYQSQAVTATVPALTADTGTITAAANWSAVRYRLVPTPYDATADGFYSSFEAGALSGLIVSGG